MKMMNLKIVVILLALMGFDTCRADGFGLVKIALAPLREGPSHAAEMGTQLPVGSPLSLDSIVDDEWWQLTTAEGYKGYVHVSSVAVMSEAEAHAWRDTHRATPRVPVALLTRLDGFTPAGFIPYGGVAEVVADVAGIDNDDLLLKLPGGEHVLGKTADFYRFEPIIRESIDAEGIESVISMAEQMQGSPYLWGGTCFYGIDCSGLTQTCMRAAGVLLPRNASQQVDLGLEVPSVEQAERGDLLFFRGPTGRVDHVAIYLGNNELIQSSGIVYKATMDKSKASTEMPYYGRRVSDIRRLREAKGLPLLQYNKLYFNKL